MLLLSISQQANIRVLKKYLLREMILDALPNFSRDFRPMA